MLCLRERASSLASREILLLLSLVFFMFSRVIISTFAWQLLVHVNQDTRAPIVLTPTYPSTHTHSLIMRGRRDAGDETRAGVAQHPEGGDREASGGHRIEAGALVKITQSLHAIM